MGCAGRAVVGIGGAVEVPVAGGSGCDVEGIRGRPAGVLCSIWIGDKVPPDLGGGEGGGAGCVVLERLALLRRQLTVVGGRLTVRERRGPALAETGQ